MCVCVCVCVCVLLYIPMINLIHSIGTIKLAQMIPKKIE